MSQADRPATSFSAEEIRAASGEILSALEDQTRAAEAARAVSDFVRYQVAPPQFDETAAFTPEQMQQVIDGFTVPDRPALIGTPHDPPRAGQVSIGAYELQSTEFDPNCVASLSGSAAPMISVDPASGPDQSVMSLGSPEGTYTSHSGRTATLEEMREALRRMNREAPLAPRPNLGDLLHQGAEALLQSQGIPAGLFAAHQPAPPVLGTPGPQAARPNRNGDVFASDVMSRAALSGPYTPAPGFTHEIGEVMSRLSPTDPFSQELAIGFQKCVLRHCTGRRDGSHAVCQTHRNSRLAVNDVERDRISRLDMLRAFLSVESLAFVRDWIILEEASLSLAVPYDDRLLHFSACLLNCCCSGGSCRNVRSFSSNGAKMLCCREHGRNAQRVSDLLSDLCSRRALLLTYLAPAGAARCLLSDLAEREVSFLNRKQVRYEAMSSVVEEQELPFGEVPSVEAQRWNSSAPSGASYGPFLIERSLREQLRSRNAERSEESEKALFEYLQTQMAEYERLRKKFAKPAPEPVVNKRILILEGKENVDVANKLSAGAD